ncbi:MULTISPECIES: non-hydrolyzing UDP-N-acetylglucosamine 2-epimerase [unclassified Luteococcus]|uniref:non-hydrolyzing UDP-N-acetylglucosamine 2-epimerase n=1 Tax=unclassified Luteococcus TaxID=2639923 RepID=UPI00313BFD79
MNQPGGTDEVLVVVGTRPEAIKLAGIARLLGAGGRVLHTGQHYDEAMWRNVLADLAGVRVADHIDVGGRLRGEQIGLATMELTRYLTEHPVRAVVVQGDTNSTLAGGLAASATGTPLVHVEAGLRSHDRTMPEEINRILVDQVADLCCTPLEANAAQLRREGVTDDRICITGNTLLDAISVVSPDDAERGRLLAELDLTEGGYVLSTVHRAGTVDDERKLTQLVEALAALAERTTVLVPMHPHTAKNIERWGLGDRLGKVRVIGPQPPRTFVGLESGAGLLVSDSGGVQEEACLFRRPLLVVRDSTERPELLDGWCRLLGDEDPTDAMLRAWADAPAWRAGLAERPLPYPEHSASRLIVDEINRRWPAS